MRRISATALLTYLRCREEYRLSYVLGHWPKKDEDHALDFGVAMHAGLEVWWPTLDVERAIKAAQGCKRTEGRLDAYDMVTLEVMLYGYHARWAEEQARFTNVRAEVPFSIAGHGYSLVGKIDVDGDERVTGLPILGEHKTTNSWDIGEGGQYWETLRFDLQAGLYLDAASRLRGRPVDTVVYDVIRKPDFAPKLATPEAERKYTKGKKATKTKPAEPPRLYAHQREHDETPAEYRARLIDKIAANPDAFYQRRDIVRLDHEVARLRDNVHVLAREMATLDADTPQPQSTKACRRYGGRPCPYLDVCAGWASINDSARFAQPMEDTKS